MLLRNRLRKYNLHAKAEEMEGGGGNDGDDGGNDNDPPPGDGDGDAGDQPPAWPDNWREQMAGDDAKLLDRINRYTSPQAVAQALGSIQHKLSADQYIAKLSEKPTDEELANYRKALGVPEKAEEYKFEVDDEDKSALEDFQKVAHEANMTAQQAQNMLDWHFKSQEQVLNERVDLDNQQRQETLDALNLEWGGDFRTNINLIENILSDLPDSVRDDFKGARLPDGTAVFNHPEVMRAFAGLARKLNPTGTITPVDGDPMKGIADRIAEIKKYRAEQPTKYRKDDAVQKEERELISHLEKHDAKLLKELYG